jgi:transposase
MMSADSIPLSRFAGGRRVAAYVGFDPMGYSSGERQRFGSISKGGSSLLRYLLVEAAQIAVRRDEGLKRFYLRLLRRLRDGIDYAEFLRRGVEARPARLAT